ncbi:MAG: hypothetical protein LBR38_05645 [Synergistaceae bacterium]|nr:hypothetical protein [Synergistaceae bacterium]
MRPALRGIIARRGRSRVGVEEEELANFRLSISFQPKQDVNSNPNDRRFEPATPASDLTLDTELLSGDSSVKSAVEQALGKTLVVPAAARRACPCSWFYSRSRSRSRCPAYSGCDFLCRGAQNLIDLC